MNRRPPMSPPDIPGFTFERLLGSGGYSDVFLYQQQMPRRPVAIKVLLVDRLDDRVLRQVADEANAMAAVSTHPYIVTIFHAELTGTGNPFLVMEYYPRPNFSVRARTEQLSVAEVLRAGIQVASAVETAHRAGIIHRDIKPANILTSEYGRPGLTDFGIAGLSEGSNDPAEGLSVPWSPPEIINATSGGDVPSDVYSLGATIYSLLVGRSPYEVVGGSNRTLDLLERIERADLPPTGRPDVPQSLERLLRHAMARHPEDRPSSAAELARALQDIEVQEQFAMTALEVRDEGGPAPRSRTVGDDEDGTRLKSPTVIQSQRPVPNPGVTASPASTAPTGAAARAEPGVGGASGLVSGVPGMAPEGATVMRSSVVGGLGADSVAAPSFGPTIASPPDADQPQVSMPVPESSWYQAPSAPPALSESTGTRPRMLIRAAWIGLVIVVLLAAARIAVSGTGDPPSTTTTSEVVTGVPSGVGGSRRKPPAPTDARVETAADGSVVARWTAPEGAKTGDVYVVTPAGSGIEASSEFPQPEAGETSVVVPAGTTCVWVRTLRGSVESQVASNCPSGTGG